MSDERHGVARSGGNHGFSPTTIRTVRSSSSGASSVIEATRAAMKARPIVAATARPRSPASRITSTTPFCGSGGVSPSVGTAPRPCLYGLHHLRRQGPGLLVGVRREHLEPDVGELAHHLGQVGQLRRVEVAVGVAQGLRSHHEQAAADRHHGADEAHGAASRAAETAWRRTGQPARQNRRPSGGCRGHRGSRDRRRATWRGCFSEGRAGLQMSSTLVIIR